MTPAPFQEHLPRNPTSPALLLSAEMDAKFHTWLKHPVYSGWYFPDTEGAGEPPACRERGRHLHTILQTG